jgi:antitoxin component YwqK of YwqJK toxin-antitoxin module
MKKLVLVLGIVVFGTAHIHAQVGSNRDIIDFKELTMPEFELEQIDTGIWYYGLANIPSHFVTLYSTDRKYKRELYYYDSTLLREINFIRNPSGRGPYLRHGISKFWYETGEIESIGISSFGNSLYLGFYVDGVPKDVMRFGSYDRNTGETEGVYFEYHPNGFLKSRHYRNHKVDTVCNYYDNGVLESKGLTSGSWRLGAWQSYYRDGTLKILSNWAFKLPPYEGETWPNEKGEQAPLFRRWKNGTWQLFSKEGKLLLERDYEMDVLIEERDFRTVDQKKQYPSEEIMPKTDNLW